jgi:hypothetical protein
MRRSWSAVLSAGHRADARDRLLDRQLLGLEVVPDHDLVGSSAAQRHQLGDARAGVALLRAASTTPIAALRNIRPGRRARRRRRRGRSGARASARQRRQLVAVVGEAEIGGLLHEQRPRRDPQPELALLVRMDGELVGLLAVALEEARLGLADVHHVEEGGIGQQLDVFVGRRRRGGDEAIAVGVCPRTAA